MNYVTNYYKNLSEQLQEKVNVLQHKLQYLNEKAAPPDFNREMYEIFIERLLRGLTKSGSGKVKLPEFLESFKEYSIKLGRNDWSTTFLPLEFINMLVHGENFIQFEGRLLNISKDGRYLLERLPNGDIVIVKNISRSPWGEWRGGRSVYYPNDDVVPKRPIFGGGWGDFTPAVVAPFFLERDDDAVGGGFRVDQEPGEATPTPPQSLPVTPVRNWSQNWHP